MRVAILGAGGAGVCTALELAARGQSVDLYDENPLPISRASRNNEGKIHLGLVYARDASLKTAKTMIEGAIHFTACLQRWIDIHPDDQALSSPYYYAVHHGTMTGPETLERHYRQCQRLLQDACAATGLSYLGRDRTLTAQQLPQRDVERLFCADHCQAAFRTSERAVDPRAVADLLRAAVRAHSRIRFVANAQITDLAWSGASRLRVSFRLHDEDYSETYDQVANTLWHGRLALDAKLGLAPEREWLYRYKLGGWMSVALAPETVPSLTVVLGPYGDIVNFGARGLYLCWYPVGMIGTSRELRPPEWDASLKPPTWQRSLRRGFEELRSRCPGLGAADYSADVMSPAGGIIFAWGATDIDAEDSRLHTRHEIGVHSVGNYHSVNTGKYTMAPYLGLKTAERILGLST
jgi:hypothetical protein